MTDLLACCVCLVTDVKLFELSKYHLQNAYEILSGSKILHIGQYVCSYCGLMLRKFEAFRRQCMETRFYFMTTFNNTAVPSNDALTKPTKNHLTPYQKTDIQCNTFPTSVDVKEETSTDCQYDDVVDSLSQSDSEECLKQEVFVKSELCVDEVLNNFGDVGGNVEIVLLSKEQQIQEVLDRKLSYNYKSSLYKCDRCFKGFLTETTYSNHMLRHDPQVSGNVVCDICQFCWPDKRSLNEHVTNVHERQYLCKLCNRVSKTNSGAKDHSKYHSGLLYTCKHCNSSFDVKTSYFTHLRLQHPSKHCCDQCGESFVSDKGLRMHRKRAHRCLEKTARKSLHTCTECAVQFANTDALRRHKAVTDHDTKDENTRSCVKCGDNLPSEDDLYEHLKTHQGSGTVMCQECAKSFANEHALGLHYQRVHLGIKRHCRPEVRRNANLVCEVCGKVCCSRASLVSHQRTHTGEKPYRCPECPKSFSVHQRLQIHVRTHTGESPFQCVHCPKAFKQKAALNRHLRVHSGVRPYQCPHCTKSFSQSNSVKMHIRTVHLKMPCPYKHKRNTKDMTTEMSA